MAAHKVSMQVSHEIPIGNVDITLPVRKGTKLLGTLTISQGGVDWKKAHARRSVSVNWTRFAELMASVWERTPDSARVLSSFVGSATETSV